MVGMDEGGWRWEKYLDGEDGWRMMEVGEIDG